MTRLCEDENPKGFVPALVRDVVENQRRLAERDTPTHRRDLVRAVFSAIEGVLWDTKTALYEHAKQLSHLSPHEQAALLEESYSVDQRGVVRPQPRFLPTATAVRLIVSIVQRLRPTFSVDFEHVGWTRLKLAIEVRNRIIHPKRMQDQSVSDDEVAACLSGFSWILAIALETRAEMKDHLSALRGELEATAEAYERRGSGGEGARGANH